MGISFYSSTYAVLHTDTINFHTSTRIKHVLRNNDTYHLA